MTTHLKSALPYALAAGTLAVAVAGITIGQKGASSLGKFRIRRST